jgi:ABC-type glycerol-3-phosphate transport system permease component
MIPVGQLPSVILQSARELHPGLHPLLAETSLVAELERSAIIAIAASTIAVLLSLLIAYALPRARPDRQGPRAAGLFVPLMFAAMFLFLPLWLICLRSNLLTPSVALVLIYALSVLPFCIWQLRCSLDSIPPELEEAARIDGCSAGQFFRRVVLPIIAPNLLVTIVYPLIAAWSLCVITPSILQTNGFDSAAVGIALAPLVVLFLVLSVCLVRNARSSSQISTP